MSNLWATSGADLHLELAATRVRAGLEAALREAVRDGRLAPGLKLPSSRTLAADLGIARNTVADAYGQLVAEGWLTAIGGSGTSVAVRPQALQAEMEPHEETTRLRYDLRPGSPDTSAFPRSGWLASARRALTVAPADALGYGDPRGRLELREALAAYLARARGVRVKPERVVVCAGFTQGLGLLCLALVARGADAIAMEAYGLRDHRAIAVGAGLRVDPLAVDGEGAVVDQLCDQGGVVLTPAHQFPLGSPLAPNRRAQVADWAAASGGLIIEDDYDGEFRYDRQPVGAMQALAPDQVVYAGTASKSLAPGLRLGWLVLPAQLMDEVVAAKLLADRGSGSIEQLTLAEFITSGRYDRHIRRARLVYRRRRDRLLAALRDHVPGVRATGIAAGLHCVVELAADCEEQELVERAARRGLALEGLGAYRALPVEAEAGTRTRRLAAAYEERPPALVVGYATPPEHAFNEAIARLLATLSRGHTPAASGSRASPSLS